MSTLRLIVAILLILPVGIVMLAAGAVAISLTFVMSLFCRLRDACNLLLEALLRELFSPS